MELHELSFRIVYRPGRRNQVADYLIRNQELDYDEEVNQESHFEDRVFITGGIPSRLFNKILEGQVRDEVIRKALTEIDREGQVRMIS